MATSMTELPEVSPTISMTSRIGTPLRINCAKVRAKRVMQILWISGPKIGSFSFQRSHASRPRFVLQQVPDAEEDARRCRR